ncbi:unnamed protein product, partial [marine sediment metagenome]
PASVVQDLHIHTTFSTGDDSVVPEQTVEFIAQFRHAEILGISDHLKYISGNNFTEYKNTLRAHDFYVGTEVDGAKEAGSAAELDLDYYIYHCRDKTEDYRGAEKLLLTEKPVIIAHPLKLQTDLNRVPSSCLIEINNRYIWRSNWRTELAPFRSRFGFVISSDAHQPHWLNQTIARHVALELRIKEALLFPLTV